MNWTSQRLLSTFWSHRVFQHGSSSFGFRGSAHFRGSAIFPSSALSRRVPANGRFLSTSPTISNHHFGEPRSKYSVNWIASIDPLRSVCDRRCLRTVSWQTYIAPDLSSSPLRNQTRLFADVDSSKRRETKEIEDSLSKDIVDDADDSKLSLAQRFKKMWKQYWYVLLPVHAVTSCAWFGIFYAVAASGIDVIGFLEMLHIPDKILDHLRNAPHAGHFVVALALYKIVTPLRYMSTLGVTYYAIKSLSRLGYIKPMPSRKQLKAMIDEKRDQFRRRRHRWRQERRFIVFKKRPPPTPPSNGHHHHHHHQPKKPQE